MRNKKTFVATAVGLTLAAVHVLSPGEAAAQTAIPPAATRDSGWGTVSDVGLIVAAAAPTLMPRVYYSDPDATVGWKGRWHFSVFAPAMTMTALTLLVDIPIKNAFESTRPGCDLDETTVLAEGCESFGGPSTHAFAAWGATGAGLGIFLVDTFKYSDGRFHAGAFIGNVMLPLTASVFTTIGRGVGPGDAEPYESGGQLLAGGLAGLATGALVGVTYAMFQRPSCGYGNAIFCW